MTKRYRLDPDQPRRLTPGEARRLDETPIIDYSDIPPLADLDWRNCPDVERSADTFGGAWRVKGHRVPVAAILDNAEAGCSAEEIAGPDIFPSLTVEQVRRILDFAGVDDWAACPDAERRGGQWVVKGSTVPVQAIIDEAWNGQMPQTTAQLYRVPLDIVRRILAFAGCFGRHEMTPPR